MGIKHFSDMESIRRTHDISYMKADPDLIYELASKVERWPEILPHYRWVKVLEESQEGRLVEMAARRGVVPVWWRALQTLDPKSRLITYRHTEGATKGMYVEWMIDLLPDRTTRVEIIHDLLLDVPLVNSMAGKLIVSRFFISHIAGRTLAYMKKAAEQGVTV